MSNAPITQGAKVRILSSTVGSTHAGEVGIVHRFAPGYRGLPGSYSVRFPDGVLSTYWETEIEEAPNA